MTTLAQIKKIAKADFIPAMKERGFSQNSKAAMDFYREGDDGIYHMITFYILRSGENLRIHVYGWVKEIDEDIDISKFPRGTSMINGDCLGEKEIGIEDKWWDIADLDNIPSVLDEVLADIDDIAIPWLDGITSRDKLIERTTIDFRCNPTFASLKKRILEGSMQGDNL